jgi:hypothetical protein
LGSLVVVLAIYLAGALVSAHLSPLARRPLLDGFVPPAPYNWVDPPPELADSNLAPSPGTARFPVGPTGSRGGFFSTPDAQVTLIVPAGAFPTRPGARAVIVRIQPIDPSPLGSAPSRLTVKGNAYLIRARYAPSDDPVERLDVPIRVIAVYPNLADDLGAHVLLLSRDGDRWTRSETRDRHATRQVDGRIATLGYVAVASRPLPSVGPGGKARAGEGIPFYVLFIVVGIVLLVVGVVLGGRSGPSDRRPPPSSDERG